MSRYSFEVSADTQVSVQGGLCPSDGEAIAKGRDILIRRLAATRAAFGHCAVLRETKDLPRRVGVWRFAQHMLQPEWESAHDEVVLSDAGKAEEFLREAQGAEAIARSLTDTQLRAGFEELARQWRDMARRVTQHERDGALGVRRR